MFSVTEPLVITHFPKRLLFSNPERLWEVGKEMSVQQCGEERGEGRGDAERRRVSWGWNNIIVISTPGGRSQDHQTVFLISSSFYSFGQQQFFEALARCQRLCKSVSIELDTACPCPLQRAPHLVEETSTWADNYNKNILRSKYVNVTEPQNKQQETNAESQRK